MSSPTLPPSGPPRARSRFDTSRRRPSRLRSVLLATLIAVPMMFVFVWLATMVVDAVLARL